MNPIDRKLIALFLVFSLMMLSANLYAKERRGAKLIITKKDGQLIEGELITVKPNSLLLLDTEGKDVSIDVADIKVIRIVKKSKFGKGLLYGLLIGVGGGALLGLASGGDPSAWIGPRTAGEAAVWGAVVFAPLGGIIGGTIGFASGIDNTIQIEGMTDSELHAFMYKLRKKARIHDYK